MAPVEPLEHFLWREPPVVVRTERLTSRQDGEVWLTAFMHFEASSLRVYASVRLFLQYLYASGDIASDWGRTVVPET